MVRTTRSTPAVLAVAVSLLLLSACGGDDDGAAPTTTTAAAGATTAPDAAVDAGADGERADASAPDEPGQGEGGAPAGGTAQPAEPPAATGAPADGAAVPAPSGRYVYDVDGSVTFSGPTGQTQPLPPEARLTIDPADGARQRSVRDATDDDGNGSITETVLRYAPDGVRLESLKLTTRVGTFSDVREFRPSEPPLLVPTAPEPGAGSDFWMQTTDERITVHVVVAVVGGERVTIGGTAVDALVLDVTSTFSGDIEGKTAARSWIDRSRSLTVKEHSESDVRVGVNEAHSEYDAVLRSVTAS